MSYETTQASVTAWQVRGPDLKQNLKNLIGPLRGEGYIFFEILD